MNKANYSPLSFFLLLSSYPPLLPPSSPPPLLSSSSLPFPALEETDYLDLDLVEFHDEELRDIATILKLSDTTKDKLMFTVRLLWNPSISRGYFFYIMGGCIIET